MSAEIDELGLKYFKNLHKYFKNLHKFHTTLEDYMQNVLFPAATDCIEYDPDEGPYCRNCHRDLEADGSGHAINCLVKLIFEIPRL